MGQQDVSTNMEELSKYDVVHILSVDDFSATTLATSFADLVRSAMTASSNEIEEPERTPSFEGGRFAAMLGIPTVVCGPGSIEQAHKPDEYIEATQLDACDAFIAQVAQWARTAD